MMTVLASVLGPLLLEETQERTGSYRYIFPLVAAFLAILSIGCWRLRLPRQIEEEPR